MRRRVSPEQKIHQAVVQHLEARRHSGVVFLHIPNGGYRRPVDAAILKSLGTLRGAPDLMLFYRGRSYALELKAEGGKLHPHQESVLIALRDAGVEATHTHGLDQAIHKLEAWGLLKGRAA